jgi:hypothetical protein
MDKRFLSNAEWRRTAWELRRDSELTRTKKKPDALSNVRLQNTPGRRLRFALNRAFSSDG